MALHLPATLIEVALGGHPAQWFYPPVLPEHVAALVVFSVGEEFGWRGFAYPRLAERHGPVTGSLILGAVWALWHLGMWFTPEGPPGLVMLGIGMAELALWSIVFAWVFERGHRSMAVAIALHAGGHLDNVFRAPETEVRLRVLRFVVLAIAAALAARSLSKKRAALA
jgi:membrane protease YdiL (CAAX protease family)